MSAEQDRLDTAHNRQDGLALSHGSCTCLRPRLPNKSRRSEGPRPLWKLNRQFNHSLPNHKG